MKNKLLICGTIIAISICVLGCGENRYYDKHLKMEVQRLDTDLENRWSTNGVVIIGIDENGPADKFGLEEGDLISHVIGERKVKNGGDYKNAIKKAMKKDNKAILQLADKKIEAAVRKRGEKFGISVAFKDGNVTVSKIKPNSPAESADIEVGDIIQSVIDEKEIKSIKDYKEAIREIAKNDNKLTIYTSELSGIKLAAIEALGNVGDQRALDPLMAALESEDSSFRRPAAKALEELSKTVPDKRLLIDLMIKHLQRENEPDPEVRRSSAIILARLKAEKAIPALIEALKDPIPGVRFKAGLALSAIGLPAVDKLKKRLEQGDKNEQDIAASALGDIGNEEARQALVLALNKTKESTVKLTIVNALAKIGDNESISAIKQTEDKATDPGLKMFIKELVAGMEH